MLSIKQQSGKSFYFFYTSIDAEPNGLPIEKNHETIASKVASELKTNEQFNGL